MLLASTHWGSFGNGFVLDLLLCVFINAIVPNDNDKKDKP